jgi:hypothetical protein
MKIAGRNSSSTEGRKHVTVTGMIFTKLPLAGKHVLKTPVARDIKIQQTVDLLTLDRKENDGRTDGRTESPYWLRFLLRQERLIQSTVYCKQQYCWG